MKKRKLRFVVMLAILLIFGSLFTSFVSYFTAHESIITQISKTTLPLTSDNIYSEIQRDLLRPIFISSMMAKDTFVRDWLLDGEKDEDAIVRYLNEIQVHYATVTSFFVSEKSRKYYHSSGLLKKVSEQDIQDEWYFRIRKQNKDYEINVDSDSADRTTLTIFINHRIYDYSGNYIGVIGVGLAVGAVQALMESYKTRFNREVYFIDKTGEVTLSGTNDTLPQNIKHREGLSDFFEQILTTATSSITYKTKGKEHYLNSRFVPEFDWYLIVEQQEDEAEMRIQHALMLNLLVSFIISVVILVLVHLLISGYQNKLEIMATTDKLTGVANRQLFELLFQQAHNQSKRNNSTLSAIMLDLDFFKKINDNYGHPIGDEVLKSVAETIKSTIRSTDLLFRWGGEEFLIILPESNLAIATNIAEKIRKIVEKEKITASDSEVMVTISAGVACLEDAESVDKLLIYVDKGLYKAKQKGRNRVEQYNTKRI